MRSAKIAKNNNNKVDSFKINNGRLTINKWVIVRNLLRHIVRKCSLKACQLKRSLVEYNIGSYVQEYRVVKTVGFLEYEGTGEGC